MKKKKIEWDENKGLLDNFKYVRSRLLLPVASVFIFTLTGFFFSDDLVAVIIRPYISTGNKLNLFNLIEGFMLRLKASFIVALLLGMIFLVYEIWRIMKPRVSPENRNFIRLSIIIGVILFYGGVLVTFFFLLPAAIQVMLDFSPGNMANYVSAGNYMSFMMLFCFGMGLICELPVAVMILTRMGIVTPDMLSRKRKYAIVLIWVAAAVITPTVDPLTQSIVAVPLMLLYEGSILFSRMMIRRKGKE